GDLATSTKADMFDKVFPERFLQMGIAEQNMVGTAAGLATLGFVPWLSSFAVFFTHRAVDSVRVQMAQTKANVKIGAAYAGMLKAAAAVDLVVTVEEHTIYGGLGGLVAEVLSASLPKRVLRIGVEDCWGESAPNDFLLDHYGLSASRIVERIRGEIAS